MAEQSEAPRHRARGSIRIARLFGIDVMVHWSFLGLLLLVIGAYWDMGERAVAFGLIWILAIFASVVIHEFSHCIVARPRGAEVHDILLIPLGGISRMENLPEDPKDEFAIAFAGPAMSFVLGLVFIGLGVLFGAKVWPPTLFAGSWFARLAWVNILLGTFNLLPALPMDGGRLLRSILARTRSREEATRLAGRVARVLAAILVLAGFEYDVWLLLIGAFVWVGAGAEERAAMEPGEGRDEGGRPVWPMPGSNRPSGYPANLGWPPPEGAPLPPGYPPPPPGYLPAGERGGEAQREGDGGGS